MTLIYERDLDILKMYLHTNINELVSWSRLSKVKALLQSDASSRDRKHHHRIRAGYQQIQVKPNAYAFKPKLADTVQIQLLLNS